ncbi:hypothetical protein EDB83DRAFT_2318182 [Lactarius deliciosus]|nr:hypothetical protein EDB83DRAFT_2318182 [Lactarius deliciosus]
MTKNFHCAFREAVTFLKAQTFTNPVLRAQLGYPTDAIHKRVNPGFQCPQSAICVGRGILTAPVKDKKLDSPALRSHVGGSLDAVWRNSVWGTPSHHGEALVAPSLELILEKSNGFVGYSTRDTYGVAKLAIATYEEQCGVEETMHYDGTMTDIALVIYPRSVARQETLTPISGKPSLRDEDSLSLPSPFPRIRTPLVLVFRTVLSPHNHGRIHLRVTKMHGQAGPRHLLATEGDGGAAS